MSVKPRLSTLPTRNLQTYGNRRKLQKHKKYGIQERKHTAQDRQGRHQED